MIFIRDTLNDWTLQYPNRLRIERVAGPDAAPVKSDAALADDAAAWLKLEAPYWLQFFQQVNYNLPVNTVPPLQARAGGWGFLTTGWFQLQDDEALVVTLDPISAAYLAFQVSDVWGITPDYVSHTSGLNKAQSKANADGTYTYVISPRDPGVWNWIDTVGVHTGLFTVRWQQLADASPAIARAVRGGKVVKIADLKNALPAGTVRVDAAERKKQQDDHEASFALRFIN